MNAATARVQTRAIVAFAEPVGVVAGCTGGRRNDGTYTD
jgi:hypothetical protein